MKYNTRSYIKKSDFISVVIILIILGACAYINVWQDAVYLNKNVGVSFCVADFIVRNSSIFNSNIFVFALILADALIILKNDFSYSKLIISGSRIKLLNRQTKQIICHGFIYGLFYAGSIVVFSLKYTSLFVNWTYENSYFAYVNKMTKDVSYAYVLVLFVAVLILSCLIIEVMYLGFFWLIQKEIFVWIIMLTVHFVSIYFWGGALTLSYKKILKDVMPQQILINVAVAVLIYFIDRIIATKREFYSERK